MTSYINKFDENKITMSLMVKDNQLLKNYNKIWKKIERLMSIDFDSQTIYGDDDDKYIKTKIKTNDDSITTSFYNKKGYKKVPQEKIAHKCLSIIILDPFLYIYEKYHLQIILEECKYVKKNINTKNSIDKELKSEPDTDTDAEK